MCVQKCRGCSPAESGYPCGAWLGHHSEIDVILITREVAYHKGPGPVRPFVLCTRRCYTHTRTLFPIDRLSFSLSLSLSLSFTPSVSKCASPLEIPKTMRRVGGCVCIIYFVYINIMLDNLTLSYIYNLNSCPDLNVVSKTFNSIQTCGVKRFICLI